MIFDNVTDITIPQGNVIKIHESISGRVLWQKINPLNPICFSLSSGDIASSRTTDELAISCIAKNVSYLTSNTQSVLRSCFLSNSSSVSPGTACAPILSKKNVGASKFVISGSGGKYAGGPAYFFYSNGEFYSASDDGSLLFGKSDSGYRLARFYNSGSSLLNFNTNNPRSEISVYISFSPERNEYLVTGIKGGAFSLPYNFGASTSINPSGFNLAKSLWADSLNNYFALNYIPSKFLYFSEDGINWTQSIVFASGNVTDIVWLSKKGLLCALNSSKQKIAVSSDGISWFELDVPFSNPMCAAYSHELDLLCVVNNLNAYLSYNLSDWTQVSLPKKIDFRDFFYVNYGIFAGYAYKSDALLLLAAFGDEVLLDAHS